MRIKIPLKFSSVLLSFVFLLLSACSVSQDHQDKNRSVLNPNEQVETAIIEVEPESVQMPDNNTRPIEQPIERLSKPKTIIHSGTKTQPWDKPQAKLTHKQRFDGVLESHNWIRKKHGLNPLKWSANLAKYSQQWANNLGRGQHCQIKHRSGTPTFGENLYRSSALMWESGKRELVALNIKEVVKSWTDEERWYDHNRNRCQAGKVCGHYTQIVWRDTTEVGCAMKVCADKSQTWVCSYNPAGNYTGVRPY